MVNGNRVFALPHKNWWSCSVVSDFVRIESLPIESQSMSDTKPDILLKWVIGYRLLCRNVAILVCYSNGNRSLGLLGLPDWVPSSGSSTIHIRSKMRFFERPYIDRPFCPQRALRDFLSFRIIFLRFIQDESFDKFIKFTRLSSLTFLQDWRPSPCFWAVKCRTKATVDDVILVDCLLSHPDAILNNVRWRRVH